jgi:hypothetical protein
MSAFVLDNGVVCHIYFTYACGVDAILGYVRVARLRPHCPPTLGMVEVIDGSLAKAERATAKFAGRVMADWIE